MTPIVSVCVPSYRAEPFLRATLQSVLDQSMEDWELVVVDDASPDASWEIAQEFAGDPRVRLERNERNVGPAPTWNRALALARAPYVKLLCSDDLIYPLCLERQVRAFQDHPDAVLVAARRDIIDGGGRVVIRGRGLGRLRGEVDGEAAVHELVRAGINFFGEPSVVMFRSDALVASGGFSEDWQYTLDLDAYTEVLKKGSLVCLDDTVGAFRVSSTSWSANLLGQQTSQARAFYRQLASEHGIDPDSMTARVGRLRATSLGYMRILAFAVVSRVTRSDRLLAALRWPSRLRRLRPVPTPPPEL
jgi:glycosyltransferase involved in cell wall biosynthesis